MRRTLTGMLLCWAASPLRAAAPAGAAAGEALGVASIVQVLLGLAAVLALFVLLAWLARRVAVVRGASGAMRVLGSLALSTRDRLVLVEVAGDRLLLGLSPGRITALHRLPDGAALDTDAPPSSYGALQADALRRAVQARP